jgi:uncharacterized protein
MRINVAQQLKQPIGQVRRYQISEINDQDLPIEGEVQLLRTNRSILVTARLKTMVKCICSRCLEEFECPLTLDIEEEYFPTADTTSGLSLSLPEGAEGFVIDESHVLDLSEAIRQHTLLALPMKPICRDDCAGLCPDCGHNLNYGPCHCTGGTVSSPWARLQSWRPKGEESEE